MLKLTIRQTGEPIMKNILNLIKGSDSRKIIVNKAFMDKTMWFFTNDGNRQISPNVRIEISANKFGWPRSCVIKENNMPKLVFSGNKMSLGQKMDILFTLRGLKKKMTDQNDIKHHKDGLETHYVENAVYDYEYIEYDHPNG
jgi:hypothetical protein